MYLVLSTLVYVSLAIYYCLGLTLLIHLLIEVIIGLVLSTKLTLHHRFCTRH